MSSTGTTTSRSSSLRVPASTSVISRPVPATKRPISASGRCVADRPIRCIGCSSERFEALERERQVRAALRAGDGMHLVEDQRLDAAEHLPSLRRQQENSDSGVVIRMSGGLRSICWRSRCGVSPVRTATARVEPRPGERPAQVPLDVVVERLQAGSRRAAGAPRRVSGSSRSIPTRNAASVFPEPVGAWTSTCAPVAIAGQACSCAGVGPANTRSNHSRVSVEKAANGSMTPD